MIEPPHLELVQLIQLIISDNMKEIEKRTSGEQRENKLNENR